MVNPNAKLTWTKVRLIRNNKSASNKQLAERFGVTASAISQIKREVTWPESKRPPKRKYTVTREAGRKLAGVVHMKGVKS